AGGVDFDGARRERRRGAHDIAPGLSLAPSGAAEPDPHAASHDRLSDNRTLDSVIAPFAADYGAGLIFTIVLNHCGCGVTPRESAREKNLRPRPGVPRA